MSTKALKDAAKKAIKERVHWAIDYICDNCDMTNEKIAVDMGCATSTINSYRRMVTVPGLDFSLYMKKFNFSTDWFESGKGEPFPGAHKKYPEMCGQPGIITIEHENKIKQYVQAHVIKPLINDQMAVYETSDALFSSDQKINIEEAMGKAYKVLNAGTALSVALYMNIQQFAAALDTGQELRECKDLINAMQEQINALNQKVDRLSARSTTTEGQGDGSVKTAM